MIRERFKHILLAAIALVTFASCSMMTEEEPDCNPYYKVRFLFERNMLYADAFASQVGEVDLYLFDMEGHLVWQGHEEGAVLSEEGYMMDLPVAPGQYDMVAWCRKRHENATDFTLAVAPPTKPEDLRMTLDRLYDGSGAHSSSDLHALFHGSLSKVELPDEWGTHVVKMPLTKDTNNIRIQLVHLSGKDIKEGDFDFKITDRNGYLDYDNTILDDEPVEYRSWSKHEGIANMVMPVVSGDEERKVIKAEDATRAVSQVHSLVAEMTTSRLQTCREPILTVTRKADGEKVIDIPIIDYFMMVKGEYHRKMEDDEYLDRQDEYNMTFFMNEDGSWYKAVVDILSWRVVLQSEDL